MLSQQLCPFCDIESKKTIYNWIGAIPKDLLLYNRKLLFKNEVFAVIPDISPIAEYHMLVIPIKHLNAFRQISKSQNDLLAQAKSYIKNMYSGPDIQWVFFEHGMCDDGSSACVSHAHLHGLPLTNIQSLELIKAAKELNNVLDSFDSNQNYLYLEIGEQIFQWADDANCKQFFRQLITKVLQKPGRRIWQHGLLGHEYKSTKIMLRKLLSDQQSQ